MVALKQQPGNWLPGLLQSCCPLTLYYFAQRRRASFYDDCITLIADFCKSRFKFVSGDVTPRALIPAMFLLATFANRTLPVARPLRLDQPAPGTRFPCVARCIGLHCPEVVAARVAHYLKLHTMTVSKQPTKNAIRTKCKIFCIRQKQILRPCPSHFLKVTICRLHKLV